MLAHISLEFLVGTSSRLINWSKWGNPRGMKGMIRDERTASSREIPVINGSILRATVNRSSLNRERSNLHRKIERVQARSIKDERRRWYVSVSRRMHAAGRRKSIYRDRDVTPDIRAGQSTIYKLTARPLNMISFFLKTRKPDISTFAIVKYQCGTTGVVHLLCQI